MNFRDQIQNDFLQDYLTYVEGCSESPLIFHIWCALSGAGAAIGRNAWFQLGAFDIYPNQFVLLVGPSGVRKSSALSFIRKLLKEKTNVKFSPTDTAGQRQGLLTAMLPKVNDGNEEDDFVDALLKQGDEFNFDMQFNQFSDDASAPDISSILAGSVEEINTMFVCASEFTSFIGNKSQELVTCLIDLWDNLDYYSYQLKQSHFMLKKPTITMLGATTAEALFASLPTNTIETGFISRTLLVYGGQQYKSLPRPAKPDPILGEKLAIILGNLNKSFRGVFKETSDAKALLDYLYTYDAKLTDARFINYLGRRHTHLIKIVSILAACENRHTIQIKDVETAHLILSETEKDMPHAIGEYGMNPISIAKQRIINYLMTRTDPEPINQSTLWSLLNRDIINRDFIAALAELVQTGKIVTISATAEDGRTKFTQYALVSRMTAADRLKYTPKNKKRPGDLGKYMN